MSNPATARLDASGNRIYTWSGTGALEEFYSVTTIISGGIPKYLVPWASKIVAELAYGDVLARGPHSRSSAIVRRWAAEGRAYVTAQRETGMKLEKVKLTDSRDMALRYLKGEPERVRDEAGVRGSKVHEAAEELVLAHARENARLFIAGEKLPVYEADIDPHMAAFVRWLNAYRPVYLATEATVYSRTGVYAGTGDAFLSVPINGVETVLCLDYKSGRAIYPEVAVQTSAYAHGEFIGGADGVTEFPVPKVDGTAVLHITPRGCVLRRLRYDEAVYATFQYAREIFRWGVDLSRTALGDVIAPDLDDALIASLEGVA
jgi:hypothetical protein